MFTVLVGTALSVDYCARLADAYCSPHNVGTSNSRLYEALFQVLSVALAGYILTIGTLIMFIYCEILILSQFGTLLCIYATVILLFSLVFFPVLLGILGPSQDFGSLRQPLYRCFNSVAPILRLKPFDVEHIAENEQHDSKLLKSDSRRFFEPPTYQPLITPATSDAKEETKGKGRRRGSKKIKTREHTDDIHASGSEPEHVVLAATDSTSACTSLQVPQPSPVKTSSQARNSDQSKSVTISSDLFNLDESLPDQSEHASEKTGKKSKRKKSQLVSVTSKDETINLPDDEHSKQNSDGSQVKSYQ